MVEEKIDGANSAVSFDGDGGLLLQSRGHYLTGGYRESLLRYLGDSKYKTAASMETLRRTAEKYGLSPERIEWVRLCVPLAEDKIEALHRNMTPPSAAEAQAVEWICV